MNNPSPHLLIQGDFKQPRGNRVLAISARVLAILFAVLLLGTMVVYGVRVSFETNLNRVARETRETNEQNRALQVRLNRLQSYKNVEDAARRVPHLKLAESVVEVPLPKDKTTRLPMPPETRQEAPKVYGY